MEIERDDGNNVNANSSANIVGIGASETNLLIANKVDSIRKRKIVTIAILFTINLMNYIDRFSVAGMFSFMY